MTTKQSMIDVPIALQQLIKSNNSLLKTYQAQLMEDIERANLQMMQILHIDPSNGWRLDMETMKYIRIEEEPVENAPVTE